MFERRYLVLRHCIKFIWLAIIGRRVIVLCTHTIEPGSSTNLSSHAEAEGSEMQSNPNHAKQNSLHTDRIHLSHTPPCIVDVSRRDDIFKKPYQLPLRNKQFKHSLLSYKKNTNPILKELKSSIDQKYIEYWENVKVGDSIYLKIKAAKIDNLNQKNELNQYHRELYMSDKSTRKNECMCMDLNQTKMGQLVHIINPELEAAKKLKTRAEFEVDMHYTCDKIIDRTSNKTKNSHVFYNDALILFIQLHFNSLVKQLEIMRELKNEEVRLCTERQESLKRLQKAEGESEAYTNAVKVLDIHKKYVCCITKHINKLEHTISLHCSYLKILIERNLIIVPYYELSSILRYKRQTEKVRAQREKRKCLLKKSNISEAGPSAINPE